MGTLAQAAPTPALTAQQSQAVTDHIAAGMRAQTQTAAQAPTPNQVPYKFLNTAGAVVGRLLPDGKVEDIGETTEMYPSVAACLAAYGYALVPDEYLMQLAECFGGVPHIDLSMMAPAVATVAQAAATKTRRGKGAQAQAQPAVTITGQTGVTVEEIPLVTRAQVQQAHTDPAVAQFMATQAQAAQTVAAAPTANGAAVLYSPEAPTVFMPVTPTATPVQLAMPSPHVPNQPLTLLEKLQAAEIFLAAVGSPYIVDVQHHLSGVRAAEKFLGDLHSRL